MTPRALELTTRHGCRRDLGLLQVGELLFYPEDKGLLFIRIKELRSILLDHQCDHRCIIPVFVWIGGSVVLSPDLY